MIWQRMIMQKTEYHGIDKGYLNAGVELTINEHLSLKFITHDLLENRPHAESFNRSIQINYRWSFGKKIMKRFNFTIINYILFAISVLMIVIAYILLAIGDKTFSPILLIVSHIIILPLSFLYKSNE